MEAKGKTSTERGIGGSRLELLGAFRLICGGRDLELPVSCQKVLALLGINDRPMERAEVAATLWPDTPDEQGQSNLRSALWRIRRAGGDLVATRRARLEIASDVVVDVRRTAQVARALLAGGEDCDLSVDPTRLGVRLLPGWYDDWVLVEQERLRQLVAHALEQLALVLASRGRFGEAVDAGLTAVRMEPLRESAHRVVMTIHLHQGNRTDALTQYERLERSLRSELGVRPSEQTMALAASARLRVVERSSLSGEVVGVASRHVDSRRATAGASDRSPESVSSMARGRLGLGGQHG